MSRNLAFESLKGILIYLVVVGHILTGDYTHILNQHFEINLRGIIYLFHMPLFFAVSGWFFNPDSSKTKILLWCKNLGIIFLVSALLHQILIIRKFDLSSLIKLVYAPFNHLWYIPALILMGIFCGTSFFKRFRNSRMFLVCLLLISITVKIVATACLDSTSLGLLKLPLRTIEFLPFFVFANRIRSSGCLNNGISFLLICAGIIGIFLQPYFDNNIISIVLYPTIMASFNFGLISFICSKFEKWTNFRVPPFALFGSRSLFIYLWHYLLIFAFNKLIPSSSLILNFTEGLLICFILALVNIILLKIEWKPLKFLGVR